MLVCFSDDTRPTLNIDHDYTCYSLDFEKAFDGMN